MASLIDKSKQKPLIKIIEKQKNRPKNSSKEFIIHQIKDKSILQLTIITNR